MIEQYAKQWQFLRSDGRFLQAQSHMMPSLNIQLATVLCDY